MTAGVESPRQEWLDFELVPWQMRWARRLIYVALLALWFAVLLNMSVSVDFGLSRTTDIYEVTRRVLVTGFVAGVVFLAMNLIVVRTIGRLSDRLTRRAFGFESVTILNIDTSEAVAAWVDGNTADDVVERAAVTREEAAASQ